MEYYSTIKKNENYFFAGKQMGLEVIVFSELRKTKFCMFLQNIDLKM
jgi:hypothetical protein